jgi:hypothetical protein
MNNIVLASFLRGYRSGTKDVSVIFGHDAVLFKVFIAQIFFRYKHTPGCMNFLNVPINHSE